MTCNISHRHIKVKEGDRIDAIIHKITTRQGTDHLVETEIHYTEAEEILVETLDKIIEGDHEAILEMTIDKTIKGEIIEETIRENRGIEI